MDMGKARVIICVGSRETTKCDYEPNEQTSKCHVSAIAQVDMRAQRTHRSARVCDSQLFAKKSSIPVPISCRPDVRLVEL